MPAASTSPLWSRVPAEAVIVAWPLLVLAWRASLPVEVFALSEDDFSRALDAWAVAHGTLLPTDMWPPAMAWVCGGLIALGVGLHGASAVVNLVAVTFALCLASDAARRLGVAPALRLAAVATVAVTRWPAWLGLSGLAEPLAALGFVAVCHGFVRLEARRSASAIAQILLGTTLASLCRYESWAGALVTTTLLWMHGGLRGWRRIAVPALPLLVPLGWTVLELHWNGNVEFLTNSRTILLSSAWRPTGGAYYLEVLTDIFDGCGPAAPFAMVALWRGRDQAGTRTVVAYWAVTALAYLLAGGFGFGGTHDSPRIWLGHALALVIGMGLCLRELALRPGWLATLVVVFAGVSLPRWEPTPEGYDADTAAIAESARRALVASPGSSVVIEAVPWACVAVDALIGDPARVSWDRVPNGEPLGPRHRSVLGGGPSALLAELARRHAAFVITGSPDHQATLVQVATPLSVAGDWTLWKLGRPQPD